MQLIAFNLLLLTISVIITQTLCKECSPITSKNIDKFCDYPGKGVVSCDYAIQPGTTSRISCKPFYEYKYATPDPLPTMITCLEDGTWDQPTFDCYPECGRTMLAGNNQMYNFRTAELGTFPWHVGVYDRNFRTEKWQYICGGSMISTELVISAAHCFYSETEDRLRETRDFVVAAGKIYRSLYNEESYQQVSEIREILVPDNYRGDRNDQRKDIAILHLKKYFDITSFVRPVCVDFGNDYTNQQLRSQQIGKVMGWGVNAEGYPNEELQAIDLPYVDYNSCKMRAPQNFRDFVTSDKICAGQLDGSRTCYGDGGGGLCFRSNGSRWYLRGILSVISHIQEGNKNRCNDRYYNAFTNVANYTRWIESKFTDPRNLIDVKLPESNYDPSCILPEPPTGGNFKHEICRGSCNYVPGFTFSKGSILEYNCEKGYYLQGNGTLICQDAGWSSRPTCIKLKYCPSITPSKGLKAVCQNDKEIVTCKRDVVAGTKATLECKPYYRMNSDGDESPRIKITCSANGTWNTNPTSYRCTPGT